MGKAMVREPQVLEALNAKLRQLDEASALRHRLRRSLSWLEPTHPLELLDLSAGFENVRQQVQVARMHAQVTRNRAKSTPIPLRACVDSAPHEQATQDGPTAAERAAADRPHGPGLVAVGVAATDTG